MCLKKCFMLFVVLALVLVQAMAWPVSITEKNQISKETVESSNQSKPSQKSEEVSNEYVMTSNDLEGMKVVKGEDLETLKKSFSTLEKNVSDLLAETGNKFFADIGVAFGFVDKTMHYGLCGDMGMRFGKGLMLKVGAQYMIGSFADIKNIGWDINKLSLNTTIGWEW